jgi:hypothetical protein
MEHDPLRHCHDTVLCLVQGGQLCFESFVGERHAISFDRDLQPQFVIALPAFVCCTVHKNGHPKSDGTRLELRWWQIAVTENYATKVDTGIDPSVKIPVSASVSPDV